jgi:hypothetical protein
MSKETMETLVRMTDSKLKVRDVVDKFILICYDLPNTEEGAAARQKFLIQAASIGAVQQTESVYFLPDSTEAEGLARGLAKTAGGEVIVWYHAEPSNKEEMTKMYDKKLEPLMKEIVQRLDAMDGFKFTKRQGMMLKMVPKTDRLLQNAEAAITRRGSQALSIWLQALQARYAQVVR